MKKKFQTLFIIIIRGCLNKIIKMIRSTKFYSKKINNIAEGCKQCVLGRKSVVFVTGLCPKNCFYCPLSEQKKNKDVIFVNERQLKCQKSKIFEHAQKQQFLTNENDTGAIIEEVTACKSYGAGFTGGDPLVKIDRTCRYIKLLKKKFGKKFHIHLYTSPESISKERLKKLNSAGLDELRLHPDLIKDKFWNKVGLCTGYKFIVGVEIPLIPRYEKQIKKLVDYFLPKINFLNLNELEISDTNACHLVERKFHTKDRLSYGVAGSEELGKKLLNYINTTYPKTNVHYCTCKLKDAVQLRNRLKLRAQNMKRKFDIVTKDGTFIRGVIYLPELKPEFNYKKKIEKINSQKIKKEKIMKKLNNMKKNLMTEFKIPAELIEIDDKKLRLITNIGVVEHLAKEIKKMKLIPAVVEQYPTYDQMEVNIDFL